MNERVIGRGAKDGGHHEWLSDVEASSTAERPTGTKVGTITHPPTQGTLKLSQHRPGRCGKGRFRRSLYSILSKILFDQSHWSIVTASANAYKQMVPGFPTIAGAPCLLSVRSEMRTQSAKVTS